MYFAVSERTAAAAMAANGNVDKWVEISQQCKVEKNGILYPKHKQSKHNLSLQYLPEPELKQLCDLVCDLLLEESNVQPGTNLNVV